MVVARLIAGVSRSRGRVSRAGLFRFYDCCFDIPRSVVDRSRLLPRAVRRQHAEQPVEPLAGAVFRYELVDPQPAIALALPAANLQHGKVLGDPR
jgi:hypothetical protein